MTVVGPLRTDIRTKNLVKRLRPGDIALISHPDLDATAARALVECRVGAVVNASPSITGRYPNRGPEVLMEAGIPLLDSVGEEFFLRAADLEGAQAVVDGSSLKVRGLCADGEPLTPAEISRRIEAARQNLSRELDLFARNTLEYLDEDRSLLLDPVHIPAVRTRIAGRHAMVVVRGEGYKDDLRTIESYLRDVSPVLIAVDGGADALLALGLRPDIIIGDMDSVSDSALRCGAELIVHGYAKGDRSSPGQDRLVQMGLAHVVFRSPGTSEDIALLLADELGASLIVAVGTHFSLVDFLDKGRAGMASTFLVRLRIGSKLMDAKGIGRLWAERRRPVTRELLLISAAALLPLGVLAVKSPLLNSALQAVRLWFQSRGARQ
jgi:uncharacterized membrane-anchored protein